MLVRRSRVKQRNQRHRGANSCPPRQPPTAAPSNRQTTAVPRRPTPTVTPTDTLTSRGQSRRSRTNRHPSTHRQTHLFRRQYTPTVPPQPEHARNTEPTGSQLKQRYAPTEHSSPTNKHPGPADRHARTRSDQHPGPTRTYTDCLNTSPTDPQPNPNTHTEEPTSTSVPDSPTSRNHPTDTPIPTVHAYTNPADRNSPFLPTHLHRSNQHPRPKPQPPPSLNRRPPPTPEPTPTFTPEPEPVAEGPLAPDFFLPSITTSGSYSLSQFRDEKSVVLVFYRGFW